LYKFEREGGKALAQWLAQDCDIKAVCPALSYFIKSLTILLIYITGIYCENDIDECKTGLLTCNAGEQCVHKPGNASCECLSGYSRVGNLCQGRVKY
jgi:hypothetical protein